MEKQVTKDMTHLEFKWQRKLLFKTKIKGQKVLMHHQSFNCF